MGLEYMVICDQLEEGRTGYGLMVWQGGAGTGSGPAGQSGTAVSGAFPGSCGGFSGGMVRTGRRRNRKKRVVMRFPGTGKRIYNF